MQRILIKALILLSLFSTIGKAEELQMENPMVLYPERYITITDWSFYVVWSGGAIIHHVTMENTSDIAYKNIKVRVGYYSHSYTNTGTKVGMEVGNLPVTLPPHSKKTYLEGGAVLGLGSNGMYARGIEILGATPLIDRN
jgi:hypothetical protein